jgi:chromosome partitioning protein
MTKIISFLNHKGGVGKTTSTINIGAALAHLGKRVLLIDLDPQASLTLSLGIDNCEKTIYSAIKDAIKSTGVLPVFNKKENLDVVPSERDLADMEFLLMKEMAGERFLSHLISPLMGKYHYILIDCPPSIGLIAINALVASDSIVIPVQAEILSLHGMKSMLTVIERVQNRLNDKLTIEGFLMTQYDARTGLHKSVVEDMRKTYGEQVFKTPIRRNIRISEAPMEREDIFSYDASSSGAKDYMSVAKAILNK